MIELGQEGRDKITGFEGTITGMARYLTGCDQYCLVPKAENGNKILEGQYFDEGRIEVTGPGITADAVASETAGGPSGKAPLNI